MKRKVVLKTIAGFIFFGASTSLFGMGETIENVHNLLNHVDKMVKDADEQVLRTFPGILNYAVGLIRGNQNNRDEVMALGTKVTVADEVSRIGGKVEEISRKILERAGEIDAEN